MPEIKMKGSIPVFSNRRSSCATTTTTTNNNNINNNNINNNHASTDVSQPPSNIPSFNTAKPRQRSLPRSVALSTNTNDQNTAMLNKYITPNNTSNGKSSQSVPPRNYNCNSLNRKKVSTNDRNNNIINLNRTFTHALLEPASRSTNVHVSNTTSSIEGARHNAKSTAIKTKLVRPSTSVAKAKKDIDKNNNVNKNHASMFHVNDATICNKMNANNVGNNIKCNPTKMNNTTTNSINNAKTTSENNETRTTHQFHAKPNFNFKENIYTPSSKSVINTSNNTNNNNNNNTNDKVNNQNSHYHIHSKISAENVKNLNNHSSNIHNGNINNVSNINNHGNNHINNTNTHNNNTNTQNNMGENEVRKGSSNGSLNSDGSKLKPPRTVFSVRSSGLVKPKSHRSSKPTSPETTTNRSLEDVLGAKSRSKMSGSKKSFRSSERILSSEKLNEPSLRETCNKPLRVQSIGRGSKSGIKFSSRRASMKKLMNDVEKNFNSSSLHNEHQSRISGSSNDSSVTSSEEKASLEYSGNFDNRVKNKGISKSHSKLMVPGFAVKATEVDKSKLAKYSTKAFNLPAPHHNSQLPNTDCQQLKTKSNVSTGSHATSSTPVKAKLKESSEMSNASNAKTKADTLKSSLMPQDNSINLEPITFNTTNSTDDTTLSNKLPQNENTLVLPPSEAITTTPNNHGDGLVSAYDIKPMAPIAMTAPYFHLNSLNSTPRDKNKNFALFFSKNTFSSCNKQTLTHDLYKVKSSFHRLNMASIDAADEMSSEAGYMSDGDLLSCKGHQRSSGYVSDGGNSLLSFDKHKRNSINPSVEDDTEVKRGSKNTRYYADTNSSIYEENFDALSSLSSTEDAQESSEHHACLLSTSASEHQFMDERDATTNKDFDRCLKLRSTMPAKGRRAILPLCGFVKKAHENEVVVAGKEEAELDVEVLFENKMSTTKCNMPGHSEASTASPTISQAPSKINEGMVELGHLMSNYKPAKYNTENLFLPNQSFPTHHDPSALNFGGSNHQMSSHSLKSIPYNYSLRSNYPFADLKQLPTSDTSPMPSAAAGNSEANGLLGGCQRGVWNRDGVTGSKFGMSLEQCYNSGVFQKRNSSNTSANNLLGNLFPVSDIFQTQKSPNLNNISPSNPNISNPSNRNSNSDIIRNNPNINKNHAEKTLSTASDGDQGYGKTPPKTNHYATMSKSQMAMRMARKLEMGKVEADKGYVRSCYATPITNRKSDISVYYPDDSSSLNSLPFRSPKTSVAAYPSHQVYLDESCYSGGAGSACGGSVISGVSGNYMLHRSGSYKVKSSRPPSTNENGSTLSLGSCSSLYSTTEEHHAQEIRKLRHELETAHSRVASLNMQLNINENVVQAFEQSIASLNQRLHHLTEATSHGAKEVDFTDMKSCFDQIEPFKTTIPENSSSASSLNHQNEMERKKKQKKWLMSFGKSFFKKKNKLSHYENELVEMNPHAEENSYSTSNINHSHINTSNSAKRSNKSNRNISNSKVNCNSDTNTANSNYNIVISNCANDNAAVQNGDKKQMLSQHGAADNSDSLEALEQRLHEKELKLTDVQLEALSSAHQLDQLKDNMAQMEKEMLYLKMDNSRLKQQLVGVSRSSLNEDDENDENEVSSSTPSTNIHHQRPVDSSSLPHKRIILYVQFKHTSHYNSIALSEVKSKEILFGKMYLTEIMGWETLNRTVSRKFESYLARVDSEEHLGLSQKSIKHLRVGELSWTLDGPSPRMSPSSYFIGFNNSVSITLKGVNENSLDALAFETMISKMILERYVGLLLDFRRVIFCGPSGTGKTYLALKLAQYMYDRLAKERKEPRLSVFNVNHKSSKELRQHLSNITRKCIKSSSRQSDNVAGSNSKCNDNADQGHMVDGCENKEGAIAHVNIPVTTDTSSPSSPSKSAANVVITNISAQDHLSHNNIIVLDNLHHVVSLADVFNGFVSRGTQNSPYVIGTMSQMSSSSTTNLQLHHMFRWVLYSNHIRPVSGFLGRFLCRHMIEREVLGDDGCEAEKGLSDEKISIDKQTSSVEGVEAELRATIEWVPEVWQHVNKLLEAHNSSEVTLGPQLYLSCPMGGRLMRVWFTDLWNYSIFPYIVEAFKEGIQAFGCRAPWEDPTVWLEQTCPWQPHNDSSLQLLHLRPEDVGYDLQQQPQLPQLQQKQQQQQKSQQQQQQQQNYQQAASHLNGNFKLQKNTNASEINTIAFQDTLNNNIDTDNNQYNSSDNQIVNNTLEQSYATEQNIPESLMNMLLKIKEARSQPETLHCSESHVLNPNN